MSILFIIDVVNHCLDPHLLSFKLYFFVPQGIQLKSAKGGTLSPSLLELSCLDSRLLYPKMRNSPLIEGRGQNFFFCWVEKETPSRTVPNMFVHHDKERGLRNNNHYTKMIIPHRSKNYMICSCSLMY